jgi:hypothetical protein
VSKAQPGANAPAPKPDEVEPGDPEGNIVGRLNVITSAANAGASRKLPPSAAEDGLPDPDKL